MEAAAIRVPYYVYTCVRLCTVLCTLDTGKADVDLSMKYVVNGCDFSFV